MRIEEENDEKSVIKNIVDIIYYIIMSIITFFSLVDIYISIHSSDEKTKVEPQTNNNTEFETIPLQR